MRRGWEVAWFGVGSVFLMPHSYLFSARTQKLVQLFDRGAIGVSRTHVPPPRLRHSLPLAARGDPCGCWLATFREAFDATKEKDFLAVVQFSLLGVDL